MVSERCYEKYIFSLELCHTKNEIKYLWQAIRTVGRALLKKFIDINQGLSMYLKCACNSESTYIHICTYIVLFTWIWMILLGLFIHFCKKEFKWLFIQNFWKENILLCCLYIALAWILMIPGKTYKGKSLRNINRNSL